METRTTVLQRLPRLALTTLALGACAWWSITLAAGPSGFSMLWVPSGVLFGVLLVAPRREHAGYLAGALLAFMAANVQRNGAGPLTLVLALCSVFDAWFAARVVAGRVRDVRQLGNISRTLRVGAAAIVLACTLSGLVAASARWLLLPGAVAFEVLFETWLASHALGMAIFGSLAVIVRVEGRRMLGPPGKRRELAATLVLVAASAWFLFFQDFLPTAFLLMLPLVVCVLRHRFSGFVPAIALIALIAAMGTAAAQGPFVQGIGATDEVARSRMLQLFLACCCGIAFPVAAILTERRIIGHRLVRSEQQYRMLADYSRDLIIRVGPGRSLDYISPSVSEMLGWSRAEFRAQRWELIHPDDLDIVRDAMTPLYEQGGMASFVYRCRHRLGRYVWLAANVRSVDDDNGRPTLVFSARDVTSRIETEQALHHQARRDPLTGLANRLLFDERLALSLARAARNHTRVGLMYLDVDHFKVINDTFGHAAGDHALQEFSRRLGECIRSVDLAVRLGGDEFAVLVEDIATPRSLKFIADKLLAMMDEPVRFGEVTLEVGTSIGIGLSGPLHADAASLMQLADGALYQAKAAGRGTWRLAISPDEYEPGASAT